MTDRALGAHALLMAVGRARVIEVMAQRTKNPCKEFELAQPAEEAELREEDMERKRHVRSMNRVVVLADAVCGLEGQQEAAHRCTVQAERLVQPVVAQEGVPDQIERMASGGLIQRDDVAVEAHKRCCSHALSLLVDLHRRAERGAQDKIHLLWQHPEAPVLAENPPARCPHLATQGSLGA